VLKPLLAASAASLALTGTASAAFAPKLQITLDPPTASKPPAITSVVSQQPGETASKTVKIGRASCRERV